jgi:hypothetical protein
MKSNRSLSPSTLALLVLAAGALLQAGAQAQSYFGNPVEGTLCRAGETVLFACPSGQKQIAVCASPTDASPFGVLRYRFGSSSHTELGLKGTWLIKSGRRLAGRAAQIKGDVAN